MRKSGRGGLMGVDCRKLKARIIKIDIDINPISRASNTS